MTGAVPAFFLPVAAGGGRGKHLNHEIGRAFRATAGQEVDPLRGEETEIRAKHVLVAEMLVEGGQLTFAGRVRFEMIANLIGDLEDHPSVAAERRGGHDEIAIDEFGERRSFAEGREIGHGVLSPGWCHDGGHSRKLAWAGGSAKR